ncbi:MAG TPA: DUF3592 domain-containing protein [Thermodesulforhabdus norvegica]|uniref:DUF3592 domain-containing protein n=1 Tax=Thermodesulforhabdus norvegica TaxID=39841 RepID=A0A7C1AMH3_9BACT|nr:DUF3592 domain-containing protein [Thermodesulforhabdus norvegica]
MNKTSRRNQLRLVLIGSGIFLVICGWSMLNQGYKSVYGIDRWLQIDAIVVESEIETVSMHNQSSSGPSSITGWKPSITYRYRIGGKEYESSRYTIMPYESTDYNKIASIVSSYPIGSTCTVYVNPDNPSEAVLSRSDQKPSMLLVIIGSLLVIIGIAMIVLSASFSWISIRTSSK